VRVKFTGRSPLAALDRGTRRQPGDRSRERVAPVGVVAELVHRRRGGREQHDVTRAGQCGGMPDRRLHHAGGGVRGDHRAIVAPRDLHDGDVRRVSRQRGDDRAAVRADHHRRPQAVRVRGHQVVDRRPLEQSAHHPHHPGGRLCGQRRRRGVRVRRLGVVDVAHPGDGRDQVRAVGAGPEPGEPGGDVLGRDTGGTGERSGGQGVGKPGRPSGAGRGLVTPRYRTQPTAAGFLPSKVLDCIIVAIKP